MRLPPVARRQLLALARQRRTLSGDPKLSQTAVVCDLIAAAWAELDAEFGGPDRPDATRQRTIALPLDAWYYLVGHMVREDLDDASQALDALLREQADFAEVVAQRMPAPGS